MVRHLPAEDLRRLYGDFNESIDHIIDGCTKLAHNEYAHRNNDVDHTPADCHEPESTAGMNAFLQLYPRDCPQKQE